MNSNHCIHVFDKYNRRCIHCGMDHREYRMYGHRHCVSRDYEELLEIELGLLYKGKEDEKVS